MEDSEEQASDTVGTGNDDRLEYIEQIADQADEVRPDDLEPYDGCVADDAEYRAKVEAEERGEEWIDPTYAAEEPPKPKTYSLKVNGKMLEVSEADLIARASKTAAADQYLADAAAARRQAEREAEEVRQRAERDAQQMRRQAAQPLDPALEAARKLKEMPEEEVAQALRSMVPVPQAQAVEQKVKDDLEFVQSVEYATKAYADLFQDENTRLLFIAKDDQLLKQRPEMRYRERYDVIAAELRTWRGSKASFADKAQRKQMLTSIPVAHSKAALTEEEDESEESHADVIRRMALARGQQIVGR
jgi:hypothetical protein